MYERIRNMREDKDLTQAQIAEYLNIHQTTYSDYELGNLNIPVPVLDKLADLFETSIDYLGTNPHPLSNCYLAALVLLPKITLMIKADTIPRIPPNKNGAPELILSHIRPAMIEDKSRPIPCSMP